MEDERYIRHDFIVHYQKIMFKNNAKLQNMIASYLAFPENQESLFIPHKDFKFIIISGASATGKDLQLNSLFAKSLSEFRRCVILKKYTTRNKRLTDLEYNIFNNRKQFDKLKKDGKILFPYTKRAFSYGFDKEQFILESSKNTLLLSVFTKFGMMKKVKQFLDGQGINSTFILFEAKLSDLIRRSNHRNYPVPEARMRINSIQHDLNFIKNNSEFINSIYDYRIDTGDENHVDHITNQLTAIIENEI